MKAFSLITCFAATVIFLSNCFAGDNNYDLAEEYLLLAKVKQMNEVSINTTVDEIVKNNPKADRVKMYDFLDAVMGWDAIKKPYTKIVVETYTEDELKAAITYLRSELGASFTAKSDTLISKITKVVIRKRIESMDLLLRATNRDKSINYEKLSAEIEKMQSLLGR